MTILDLEDELKELGICSDAEKIRVVNRAVLQLVNKGPWDATLAIADLCVKDACVWLPREIDVPLGVRLNNYPIAGRNPFADYVAGALPCGYVCGENYCCNPQLWVIEPSPLPAVNQPCDPSHLAAIGNSTDVAAGRFVRVEGMDKDDNPQAADIPLSPMNGAGCCVPNHKPFKSIHRVVISKPGTGWVRLVEHNYQAGIQGVTLGYWEPDETEPLRRVMRLTGLKCDQTYSVRLFYRRKFAGVTSIYDFIPLQSTLAIAHMIRAQKYGLDQQQEEKAEYHEGKAVQILNEELYNARPLTRSVIQPLAPFFNIRPII